MEIQSTNNNNPLSSLPNQEEEEEIEMDVYYQGTPDELLSLIYPLHSPEDPTFKSLTLTTATYQPIQKTLQMTYLPDSINNTELPSKQIHYRSKLIPNRTNYFLSTMVEQRPGKKSLVWRSISGFLQMRPTKEVRSGVVPEQSQSKSKTVNNKAQAKKDEQAIQSFVMRRDGGRLLEKKMKSYSYVRQMYESEPKQQLKIVRLGDKQNRVMDEINSAPSQPHFPIVNKLTRLEYRNSLSK